MSGKFLISTGGTGGHIFPAMALAQQLAKEIPNCQVLFVGGGLSGNRYFNRSEFAYRSIDCGAFIRKSPWSIFQSLKNIGKGICQSRAIIQEFRPDVAIGFGSFYSFPALVAAKTMSVPIILHEANSIPGKVNRLLSKYAVVSGVHFPQTRSLLSGRTVEVGMPLREGYRRSAISRKEAKQHYGFSIDKPVVLVFGGSQGSNFINDISRKALKRLNRQTPLQVLHVTGASDQADEIRLDFSKGFVPAIVKHFEQQMEMAWLAADIVISRAGACTIAEQIEFEVPGILIPYPFASDNHQEHNANFMAETVGGALMVPERGLDADTLLQKLTAILEEEKMKVMRNRMRDYKREARSLDLATLVKEVIARPELIK